MIVNLDKHDLVMHQLLFFSKVRQALSQVLLVIHLGFDHTSMTNISADAVKVL